MMRINVGLWMAVFVLAAVPSAIAQDGRYTMTERDGGMVVFDSATGRISECDNLNTPAFACTLVPDDRAALEDTLADLQDEVDRLEDENLELRDRLAALGEDLPQTLVPEPEQGEGDGDTSDLRLPSREEVDEMMDFLEHLSDRMVQMGDRMREWVGEEPSSPTLQPKEPAQ